MGRWRLRRSTLVAVMASTLAVGTLAACSSGGSSSNSTGSSSKGGVPDLGTINLGLGTSPPDLTANQFYYAVAEGFYKKLGLTVKITPYSDDQTAVRALQAGAADIIWTGAEAAMSAIEAGAQMKVISSTTPVLNFDLVGLKSISSPKELQGHRVGISAPGAVSAITPIIMIKNAGGNPNSVTQIPLGGSGARAAALVAGKIDAAVLNQPYVAQLAKYPNLHVIADAATSVPNYIYAMELASDSLISSRPKAVQAFVTGSLEADAWAIAHPSAAVKVSQSVLPGTPVADLTLAIDQLAASKYWSTTGKVSQFQWSFTVSSLVALKQLPSSIAYSTTVDTQFTNSS